MMSTFGDIASSSSFLNGNPVLPALPATGRTPVAGSAGVSMGADLIGQAMMGGTYAAPAVQTGTPINMRLPEYAKKFASKWSNVDPAYDQATVAAVKKIDAQRIVRGQPPLTEAETLTALKAAQTRQVGVDQERDPTAIFSNAVKDIGDIGRSVVHLPQALWQEANRLDEIPSALAQADGLSDTLLNTPGIRMLPGAFTVGNLANGAEGVKELGRHPLMTLLDIMPGAKKLAEAAPVVKAAEGERLAALGRAQVTALQGGPYIEPPKVNPFRTLLTRTLDDQGNVALNRVGEVTDAIAKNTRVGQFFSEAFGGQAREASSMLLHAQRSVENAIFGDMNMMPESFASHPVIGTVRKSADLLVNRAARDYGLTPQRVSELTEAMARDPQSLSSLPPNELAFVTEIRDLNAEYADYQVREGNLFRIDGEVYDAQTGARLRNLERRALKAEADFLANRLGRERAMQFDADGNPIPLTDPITGKALRPRATLRELAEAPDADPRLWNLYDLVEQGRYREARRLMDGMMRGRTRLGQSGQIGTEGLGGNVSLATLKSIYGELNGLVKKQARFEAAMRDNVPARFVDMIDQKVGEAVQARATQLTPQNAAEIAQAVAERRYGDVLPKAEVRRIQSDVQGTWRQLKEAGADPVFIHRVSPERATSIRYPRVLPENVSESQIKRRALDMSPSVHDATVAVTHQGVEILERAASERLAMDVVNRWGASMDQLRQELLPKARQMVARDPRLPLNTALGRLINDHYVVFDPESFMGFKSAKLTGMDQGQVLVPKVVAATFDRMRKPPSEVGALVSAPMQAFRTSVLALSPRWHVYNIVGGALMLQGRTGPGVWRYISQAREAINSGVLPDDMKAALGGAGRDIAELNYYKGRTLRRLWEEARAKSPVLDSAVERGSALVQKSYDFNSFFDDTYRVAAYLFGQDKALMKGMTREAAQAQGMALARKVMVNWDAMTPIERGIIKHIFPFYGFTQHMMRYAMSYPVDHPFRAAVVSAFARNELEDIKGLPDQFHNAMFFGSEDENGNRDALMVGAANPFSDLSSMFTLSGFIGGVNPFISTGLQTIGIDVMSGGPELYPQLRYDPETGVNIAQTKNPLTGLFFNTIPQARALAALAGANSEFTELMRTNPEAAKRMLRSNIGLPVTVRSYNLPEEYAKQTIEMRSAANQAKNAALRTGNDDYVNQFPQLRAYVAQLRKLQGENPEAFQPYVAPQPVSNAGDKLVAALNVTS